MPITVVTHLRPYLERLATHSLLDHQQREAILQLPFRHVVVPANNDFVQPGDASLYCCFVSDGLVGRYQSDRTGERQISALYIPGDMSNLPSAIRPGDVGSLTTLSDTVILQISHVALLQLAADHPPIKDALWRDCLLDAAVLMDWLFNVGRRSALARIAHLFCEMSVRYARGRRHLDLYSFPVTQLQLADIVAITPVHTNRMLKVLRERELVTIRNGMVSILDWDGLVRAGEFDAGYVGPDVVV